MSTSERGQYSWLLERLRRARQDRGLTQAQVAEQMGMARTSLVALESGERRLKPEEMVALAGLYGQRLDELLRPSEPPRELAAQFRESAGRMPEEDDLRHATLALQKLAEDYVELERLLDAPLPTSFPSPQTVPTDPVAGAERLATEERGRLHLGDGPLPHLRELLENDVGLRVFSVPLPSRFGGLFAYDEQLGACVAMNSRHRWERQRFSLAHEFAHFLTRRDRAEITVVIAGYRRVPAAERFADAFAQRLLMPAGGVTRRFEAAKTASGGRVTPALLLGQADFWHVSAEAMARRLEDLKLIKSGAWDQLVRRGLKPEEGRALLGLQPRQADTVLLPRRYVLLTVTAYRKGLISEERVARFLRRDRVAARRLVEELDFDLDDAPDLDAR
ncbi:helix-turn-helix domain-containing protein [Paraconexibacter algicola]|uniref:Transcriptional regulator n=1 Tax=Paraconexibacter algicola TaxID=2133960 RepID=A0A2T4UH70_9ACTN|nr:XRE family transcriptional regulator [Paraconexibacter algicola]PTL58601.1 transcriptional regulator [Paraconexibacter algicola]